MAPFSFTSVSHQSLLFKRVAQDLTLLLLLESLLGAILKVPPATIKMGAFKRPTMRVHLFVECSARMFKRHKNFYVRRKFFTDKTDGTLRQTV